MVKRNAMDNDERLTRRRIYQTAHGAFCMSEEEHRLYEEREETEGLLGADEKRRPSQDQEGIQA